MTDTAFVSREKQLRQQDASANADSSTSDIRRIGATAEVKLESEAALTAIV